MLHPTSGCPHRLIAGALIFVILAAAIVGSGPTPFESSSLGPSSPNTGQVDPFSFHSPSQYFYYPTSSIRIIILYDLSTGAQVYADAWRSLLVGYGYNASLLSLQQAMGNTDLTSNWDLIVVDHSCGGDGGGAINLGEAKALAELAKPLILLGGARGAIDRLANYEGGVGQISVVSVVQKTPSKADHSIYTSPYFIPETGYGALHSIEIFAQSVTLESYPENAVKNLSTLGIIEGAAKPVIGALYTSHGGAGRIHWWSFKDPSTLNTNGHHLLINTIEWMGGFTNLNLLVNSLEGLQSLNPSESAYWTGGYADYFEPQIAASFYAYTSLRLIGRLTAINSSALIDWLTTYCYRPLEGYFSSPNRYLSPFSWSGAAETGMALEMVSQLGALNELNLACTSNYLKTCQSIDGFVRYPGDTSKSLTNTYWALMGLNMTGALNDINKTGATNYVLSCQNLNSQDPANYGGFADRPGGVSFARYTQMALASLKLLGALGSVSQTLVEQWLMNGYVASKGIFYDEHVFHQRYMVNYGTGYSITSLSIIGKLQNIDQAYVANYLSFVQFADGGWSGANSTDEPIDEIADCYPVILGLSLLNRINTIRNLEGFVGFATRCLSPAPTYGFSNLPRTLSNLWQMADAIIVLNNLGVMDSPKVALLNASIISSYNPSSSRFEWTRYLYPLSSDGYGYVNVELPFEFTLLQRGRRGVIMANLAVTSLLTLGSGNWVRNHAQELWNEISHCEVTAGSSAGYYKGLSSDSPTNLTAGLRYTYHALSCLWALAGCLNYTSNFPSRLTNATMTINKIMSLYDPLTGLFRDDGYILEPYSPSETTFLALTSLSLLDRLSNVDYIKTTEFLQSRMYSNLMDTYYSFKGLQLLGRLSFINATRLLSFVEDCQKPSGAFKSDNVALYRLETTRMAIEILSHYNSTWVAAKPIKLVASNLEASPVMRQGSNYLVNVTVIEDFSMQQVKNASVVVMLGGHEYAATETPAMSGHYTANLAVPVDSKLLGMQNLALRCSKDTFQTNLTQNSVEILRREGSANKSLTQTTFTSPRESDYLTTSNTSVSASIYELNESAIPIQGVMLELYVNDSLVGTSMSDSSGLASYSWRPYSSGTYNLRVVFNGSSTLYASEEERAIAVDKTPTQLSVYSDYSDSELIVVGHTLQIGALLSETYGARPIASASISFIVSTPSATQVELPATAGEDGVAIVQFIVGQNGSYSIHSVFVSTVYYAGCTSNTILVEVSPSDGGGGGSSNITLTRTTFTHPSESDYLTTSNTSVVASIHALNWSQTPIEGAELKLFVNNSLVETLASNSSGLVTFNWRPHSSATYSLRVVFEGSSTLDASEADRAIQVNRTPCQLTIYSSYTGSGLLEVGHHLQLRALLSESPEGKPVADADLSFIVLAPSGARIEVGATTEENGSALMQIRLDENGSYSIHSIFESTDYYLGCTSNTLALTVGSDGQGEDGDNNTGVEGGGSWVGALLGALSTLFGGALVIGSGSLLAIVYFSRARRREVEPTSSDPRQRRGSSRFRIRLRRRLTRRSQ